MGCCKEGQGGQEACEGGECHNECCCCHDDHGFKRQFKTKAEMIAELEDYLAELKTEVQAVEEHLQDLRK